MKNAAIVLLIYGTTVLLGGLFGFMKAGSYASLLSGTMSSLLLFLAAILLFTKRSSGYWLGLGAAILLEIVFILRFIKTLHFLPAGLLSILSLAVILVLFFKIRQKQKLTS